MPLFSETDPERKKALSDTFYNQTLPFYLTRLDAIAEKNNGYLALGRVSSELIKYFIFHLSIICDIYSIKRMQRNTRI